MTTTALSHDSCQTEKDTVEDGRDETNGGETKRQSSERS